MARKRVVVQVEADLVAHLDEAAARRGISRSELLRRGPLHWLEAEALRNGDDARQEAYSRGAQDQAIVEVGPALLSARFPSGSPRRHHFGQSR